MNKSVFLMESQIGTSVGFMLRLHSLDTLHFLHGGCSYCCTKAAIVVQKSFAFNGCGVFFVGCFFFFVGIMLDDFFGCRMPKKRCILDMIPLDCFCFGIMLVGLDVWCPKEETPRLKDVPLQGNDMTYPTKRIIQKINENHQCRAGKRICDSSQEGISAKACKHLHMNLSNQKPSHGLGYFQGDPAPQIGEPTGKFPPLFCLEQIHSVFGVCTKGGFAAFFRDN